MANEMGRKITALLRSEKVVLFPEIGRVKNVLSLIHPHSPMCVNIFLIWKNKKTNNSNKKTRQKKAREREEKNIWGKI